MATFKGNGIVWNPDKNEPLCNLNNGPFTTKDEREQLYQLFFDDSTRQDLKAKLENVIFYKKPPTIEEFLDPENRWLPARCASSGQQPETDD